MSWIRLVIVFWTSQTHFIYLVHSIAGLQSKLYSPYSTEDNLDIRNVEDTIQSVCGIIMHLTWKKKITNLHKQQDKTIYSQGFQVASWLK